jgi:CheY-like chemotaxis protein
MSAASFSRTRLGRALLQVACLCRRPTGVRFFRAGRSADVERALDLGATSFLVKPISLDKLAATLRCLCDWLQFNQFAPLTESGRK